jgi:hypothetical protein
MKPGVVSSPPSVDTTRELVELEGAVVVAVVEVVVENSSTALIALSVDHDEGVVMLLGTVVSGGRVLHFDMSWSQYATSFGVIFCT